MWKLTQSWTTSRSKKGNLKKTAKEGEIKKKIEKYLEANKNENVPYQNLSFQFSGIVVSDSLRPHGLQHARIPCPSPTPGPCSNLCSLSQWCHPAISSSVDPFSYLQSFPVSGSFPMSQFFASDGQNIGASASASVLPMNIQDWFLLRFTGLISLQSKGLSRLFSNTNSTASVLWLSAFFIVQFLHPYMTTGKTRPLSMWTLSAKWCLGFLIGCLGLS